MENWRREGEFPVHTLSVFDGASRAFVEELTRASRLRYVRPGGIFHQIPGEGVQNDDALVLFQRGEARSRMFGMQTQRFHKGDTLGALRFLGADAQSPGVVTAVASCDIISIP